jgi:tetratricopeptide (TPR) repeat protein
MKFFTLTSVLFLTMLATPVFAQTAGDTLRTYVAQLQSNPNDYTLREKIISVSQRIAALPPAPDDVERYTVRGKTAFGMDQANNNYSQSIAEFQKATLPAPWLPSPYYNLAYAQDAAGDYAGAVRNYKLYLLASPNADDRDSVKTKIYELEYKSEQAANDLKAKQELEKKQKDAEQKLAELDKQQKDKQAADEQKIRKIETRKERIAREDAVAESIKADRRIRDYTYFSIGPTVPLGAFGRNPSSINPSTQFPTQGQIQNILNGVDGAGAKVFMDMNVGHVFYIKHMHVWRDRFKVGFDWCMLDGSGDRLNWTALGGNYNKANYVNAGYGPYYEYMFNLSSQFGPVFSLSPAPKFFIDIYYRFTPSLSFIFGPPVKAYNAADGINNPPSYFQFQPTTWLGYDWRHSVGLNLRYSILRVNFNFNLGRLIRQWQYTEYLAIPGTTYKPSPFSGSMFTPVFDFGVGVGIH